MFKLFMSIKSTYLLLGSKYGGTFFINWNISINLHFCQELRNS